VSFMPWTRQPPETTDVSDETERKIPLRVWRDSLLLGAFLMACVVGIAYLGFYQVAVWKGADRGWGRRAWAFTGRHWPLLSILVLICWIVSTLALLWRFQIENVSKHGPPTMTPWPAELGLWSPFGRRGRSGRPGRAGDRYDEIYGKGPEDLEEFGDDEP